MKAEYVALCEAAKHTVWVKRLLDELHVANYFVGKSGVLNYTDNQSAIAIVKGSNSSKTKHIDIAYHYVRECIQDEKINLKYIRTDQKLADILTKPLPHQKAETLCHRVFNKNLRY